MAGSAVIGALRVALGIDTAQFSQGLTSAQSRLNKFGSAAKKAFAATAVAGAAVTAALVVGIRRTVKEADEMTKMAQSIGVPVEELTRLKHAADLSGVGIDGLAKSLGRLSRGMTDIATGAGQETKKAFDALGVSIMNSDGTLKTSTQIMEEIADRFAKMEDGAAKTGLAMTIFGRSGAQLIPMLNHGGDGIARMTAEADRLGIVIDKNTGQAAEAFNDNLTRLGKVKDGIILKITAGMLPTLERLSDVFISTANDTDIMRGAADFLSGALKSLVTVGIFTSATFKSIGTIVSGVAGAIKLAWDGQWQAARESLRGMNADLEQIGAKAGEMISKVWSDAPSETQINRRVANAFGEAGRAAGDAFKVKFTETADISDHLKRMASEAMDGLTTLADATNQKVQDAKDAIAKFADYTADRFGEFFDGIRNGESAWDSLRKTALGVLDDIAMAMLRSGLQQLFLSAFGGNVMAPLQTGFSFPAFANGTSSAPGGLAWVGERGRELVNLPRGSQVIPNHELNGMAGGAITLHVMAEEGEMFRPVVRAESQGVAVKVVQNAAPGIVRQGASEAKKNYAQSGGWTTL